MELLPAIDLRDGMLSGPDLAGLGALLAATALPVVALARLQVVGRRLAGAIVGKALAEGRLSVGEGLAACAA